MKNLSLVVMEDQLRRSGQSTPGAIILESVLSKVVTPNALEQQTKEVLTDLDSR
jgi:hypothetical protein